MLQPLPLVRVSLNTGRHVIGPFTFTEDEGWGGGVEVMLKVFTAAGAGIHYEMLRRLAGAEAPLSERLLVK